MGIGMSAIREARVRQRRHSAFILRNRCERAAAACLAMLTVASAAQMPYVIPSHTWVSPGMRRTACVKWRQTGNCIPEGPREPARDQACGDLVQDHQSGYCECE